MNNANSNNINHNNRLYMNPINYNFVPYIPHPGAQNYNYNTNHLMEEVINITQTRITFLQIFTPQGVQYVQYKQVKVSK